MIELPKAFEQGRPAIRRHLESGEPLTPYQAWVLYDAQRLAMDIHALRKQGLAIVTEPAPGGRGVRYRLDPPRRPRGPVWRRLMASTAMVRGAAHVR